ncbi:uncharacterized protein LOC121376924 [Gigantopelta aegis]|uniref:uncharacterized protein LOC121376924 n=1 Tax=Gigantopelta aegis TaxID=1735272 RepID=UPI001B888E2A|nr:uncharacterized protein LOC121376924 [Gigantopelta aegis]
MSDMSDASSITSWTDDLREWPNVMYGDIYNYFITSKAIDGQDMKNFKSLQSFNYFQSGHVGKIVHHKYSSNQNKIVLKADVRRSQSIHKSSNVAHVLCQMNGTILSGWCSCMAGQGLSCSHVGALLWTIEHAVRNGLTGVSCTDETVKWNQGTKRNIEPKPIANIQFKKPKLADDIPDDATDVSTRPVHVTPMFLTHADFQEFVNNSILAPLFNINGTTISKSYISTPVSAHTPQQPHETHTSMSSCQKCTSCTKNCR